MKPIARVTTFCVGTLLSLCAVAQSYPSKPVRLLVPYSAGGKVDTLARAVASAMTKQSGQQFIVENKAGSAGAIGRQEFSRVSPDGYTLLVDRVEAVRDEGIYVHALGATTFALVVSSQSAFRSLADVAQEAKAKPGKLTVGHAGNDTVSHRVAEAVFNQLGLKVQFIPFRGEADALASSMAGQIDLLIAGVDVAKPQTEAGKLKAIAVTSIGENPDFRGVLPLSKQGLQESSFAAAWALYAPPQTSRATLSAIESLVAKAVGDPDVRAKLGAVFVQSNPHEQGTNGQPTCSAEEKWCECKKKCIPKKDTCEKACSVR